MSSAIDPRSPQSEEALHSAALEAAEDAEFTLTDAEAAYSGVSALVELLGGCQPGQQITGIFVRSLLEDVRAHLENVVGGLRVVNPCAVG